VKSFGTIANPLPLTIIQKIFLEMDLKSLLFHLLHIVAEIIDEKSEKVRNPVSTLCSSADVLLSRISAGKLNDDMDVLCVYAFFVKDKIS
jgi:hypothetical protein